MRRPIRRSIRDLKYDFRQIAAFGEVTYSFSDQLKLTGGARYFDFNEDRSLYFAGFFADYTPTPIPGKVGSDGISPRLILSYELSDDVRLNAQASRGFRLGGINDPINVPLCTPADRATFGGQKNWKDELAWNYEIGAKMRLADRKVTFNVAAFYTDISGLQANTDGGSCSSRIVFNVPKASSMGIEAELFARPNDNWDFGLSATWAKAELNSSVTSTSGNVTTVVAGLRDGARLPTAPKLQAAASIGYTLPLAEGQDFFANLTGQYVGSSFTQISDEVPGFGTLGGGAFIRYGAPTVTSVSFNPELPSYQLVNLRFGLRSDQWEVAVDANNLLDERALLSLDRERGTRARVSYLTNPPRSIGFEMRHTF